MKNYIITQEQLNAIIYALTLAEYFCQDQEPSDQKDMDTQTYNSAIIAVREVTHVI
jgi:hypothetical protein